MQKSLARYDDEGFMIENESLALQLAIEESLRDLKLGAQSVSTGSANKLPNKEAGKV